MTARIEGGHIFESLCTMLGIWLVCSRKISAVVVIIVYLVAREHKLKEKADPFCLK